MTDRLYYRTPYLREFEATVSRVEHKDGQHIVRLDRTAFYPTSGGQPFDLGTLGGRRVLDVSDADDGDVLHVLDGELAVGAHVAGAIDWPRRFDHMQQHTGQHVLSAAFDHLLTARTESFHLGSDSATIDLARELSPAEISRAEDDANRIVWEDRRVAISFVNASEASKLPLRKETGREGVLRLIDIDGYDLSACGGTHVERTGAIGIIAITGWERFKGGMRVGFACGGRALRAHRKLRDIATAATRQLSILPDELPTAIERLQAEVKDSKRAVKDLQTTLARHEAAALADAAADGRVVAALDGWDQNGLKNIAAAIADRPGYAAALISAASPAAIVIARHASVSIDAGAVIKQALAKFGGKGGGRPELAQGGGLEGDRAAILDYLRTLL